MGGIGKCGWHPEEMGSSVGGEAEIGGEGQALSRNQG